jgi:hypothetical protein
MDDRKAGKTQLIEGGMHGRGDLGTHSPLELEPVELPPSIDNEVELGRLVGRPKIRLIGLNVE